MQPAAFGKTLYLWEKEWSAGNFDLVLRRGIEELSTFLREREPTPDEEFSGGDL